MTGEKASHSLDNSSSQHRKNNKSLMEKCRRARINDCLNELKSLVLEAMKRDTSRYSKLEKADILEMTVKHIRSIQRHQMAAAVSHDPSVVNRYRAGFNECAQEVIRYLSSMDGVNSQVKVRVLNHLAECVTTSQHHQQPTHQTSVHPITIQIPTSTTMDNQSTFHMTSASITSPMGSVSSHATPVTGHTIPEPKGYANNAVIFHNQKQQNSFTSPSQATTIGGSFQVLPAQMSGNVTYVIPTNISLTPGQIPGSVIPLYSNNTSTSLMVTNLEQSLTSATSQRHDTDAQHRIQTFQAYHGNDNSHNAEKENMWRPW